MPLILAIESERRQAARITAIARDRLNVELIVTESAERALEALTALAGRTPDLILTPQLMSPKDEASLNDRLRELDAAGLHVQTLMIPVLASSGKTEKKEGGLLSRLRRGKAEAVATGEGCDPEVFATQISEYLERAAEERAALAARQEDEREYREAHPAPAAVESEAPEPVQAIEQELAETPPPVQPYGEPLRAMEDAAEPNRGFLSESMLASIDPEPVVERPRPPVTDSERSEMISFLDSMLDPTQAPVTPPVVSREVSQDVSQDISAVSHKAYGIDISGDVSHDVSHRASGSDVSGSFSHRDASGSDVSGSFSHRDASGIDVSGILDIDDVMVNDSNTSADALWRFEEPAPRAPVEQPRAVPADVSAREAAPKPAPARRDVLDEFIEFDELGVMDGPSVTLGEFEGFGQGTTVSEQHAEALASAAPDRSARRASSVLDAIELLDGPEISDSIDYRQEPADRHQRRVTSDAAAAARTTAALEDFFEEPESEPAGSAFDFDGDLFTPLPIATQQHWPRPQGPTVKAAVFATPAFDAPPDPGVEFAPIPSATNGKKKLKLQKPAQDEWGLFDPAQCGFAALLEKLNEVTDKEEAEPVGR